jgi:hypothetical protein
MAQGPGFYPEGEEVMKMDNITKTKRKKIPPREVRIKAYHYAHKLRKRGLTIQEIRRKIYQKYGIWLGKNTVGDWLRGVHNPYNGRRIPSLERLQPSEDSSTRKRMSTRLATYISTIPTMSYSFTPKGFSGDTSA